jgi:hypothetical protein
VGSDEDVAQQRREPDAMKQEPDSDCQPLPARLATEHAAELEPEHLTTEQAEERQGDVRLPGEVVPAEPENIQDESVEPAPAANPSVDPEQDPVSPQPTR